MIGNTPNPRFNNPAKLSAATLAVLALAFPASASAAHNHGHAKSHANDHMCPISCYHVDKQV